MAWRGNREGVDDGAICRGRVVLGREKKGLGGCWEGEGKARGAAGR